MNWDEVREILRSSGEEKFPGSLLPPPAKLTVLGGEGWAGLTESSMQENPLEKAGAYLNFLRLGKKGDVRENGRSREKMGD